MPSQPTDVSSRFAKPDRQVRWWTVCRWGVRAICRYKPGRVEARPAGSDCRERVPAIDEDTDDRPVWAIIDHRELQGQDGKATSSGQLRMVHADGVHRYAGTIVGRAGEARNAAQSSQRPAPRAAPRSGTKSSGSGEGQH
jgi:hypothetical protein